MANQNNITRFFKINQLEPSGLSADNIFLLSDSNAFRRPRTITVETLGKVLNLNINDDLDSKNVSAVQYKGLDQDVSANPDKMPISSSLHLSVDENYLYVWVPQIGRWKRMLLSSWVSEIGESL